MYSLYISSVGQTMCGVHGAFEHSLIHLFNSSLFYCFVWHTQKHYCSCLLTCRQEIYAIMCASTHTPHLFSITLQWYFCATASQFIPWFVIAHLKYGTVSIYCTLKNNHGQSTTVAIGNEKLNGKTNKRIRAWYLNRNINAQKMPFTQNWYNWTMELNTNCESSKEISAIK